MYYLEQKQLTPALTLLSFLFIPCIIGLTLLNIISFKLGLLILLLIISGIYLTLIFVFLKLCKKQNHYLLIEKDRVEIAFLDFTDGENKIELKFDQILKLEYYRINSIRGWLMLFSYILPKCVYITFILEDKVQKKFIGYMDIDDVEKISNTIGIQPQIF